MKTARFDIHAYITERIIAALERGVGPWVRPWKGNKGPHNGTSGRLYRGVNPWLLAVRAEENGWTDPRWCTENQALKKGWRFKDSAFDKHGELDLGVVVCWWFRKNTRTLKNGDERQERVPFMQFYRVANFEQLEGPKRYDDSLPGRWQQEQRRDKARKLVDALPVCIRHGGDSACYDPRKDIVHMPVPAAFAREDDYWVTLFHELGHWTGSDVRLERDFSGRFGEEAYAIEELVAELTAANMASHLEIGECGQVRPDHARYIGHWLEVLRRDTRAISHAASKADQATRYLLEQAEAGTSRRRSKRRRTRHDRSRPMAMAV